MEPTERDEDGYMSFSIFDNQKAHLQYLPPKSGIPRRRSKRGGPWFRILDGLGLSRRLPVNHTRERRSLQARRRVENTGGGSEERA